MSERARFAKFLVAGGLAAGVNVAARWLLSLILVYEAAVAVAYVIGMSAAFIMNRAFVFDLSQKALHVQYARFATVNLIAFVQVWLISVGLDRQLLPLLGFDWHRETIAHMVGVASPILTSYAGHKYFSFR